MSSYTDIHRDIVERCKQGSREAQFELYKLYGKAMFNVSLRIMNSREEAEDIVQETFIDVFNKLDTFRGDSTIGAWIKRITVNKSLNAIKKKRLTLTEMDGLEIEDDGADVIQKEQEFEYTVDKVKEGIEQLPDGYRMVLSLYLIEGYSHKDIANQLDITESTSKSQYNRAKKKLKELILS